MNLTLKIMASYLVFSIISVGKTHAQTENTIIGKWKNVEDNTKQIEIYLAKDNLFYGKENGGKIVLRQLKFNASSKTYKGLMTPPDKDISLNIEISFETKTKLKLVAKKFIITKTMYLIKSNN